MGNFFKDKLKKISKTSWVLLGIILIGIFLRTYHFHDWLYFVTDQVRDTSSAEKVIRGEAPWPLLGPSMRNSAVPEENIFCLGPIYYYFQIISGKIFGPSSETMAYPDLLFGILAIPLFYLFLKRFFSLNISLALTGLFSVSFFAIKYSRFAWNPNSTPFFVLLLLLSLYEFMTNKERVDWKWIASLGIAIGIGIQLHAILLILFPATTLFIFVFLMKKNWRLWKKWAVVLAVVVFLNIPQIINEFETGFMNSRNFVYSLETKNRNENNNLLKNIGEDADCHIEANFFMLSSLGENTCNLSYIKILFSSKSAKFIAKTKNNIFWLEIISGFLLSAFGYGLLIYHSFKETNERKKYFLRLITLYATLSFFIMQSILVNPEFRYFINTLFIPFILLGFIIDFLLKKFYRRSLVVSISICIFIFFLTTNIFSIQSFAKEFSANTANDAHFVFLGETEHMANYLVDYSKNQNEIYLIGGSMYVSTFSKPLGYLLEKQQLTLIPAENMVRVIPPEKPLFYITQNSDEKPDLEIRDRKVENYKNFGRIRIYQLEN